MIWLWGGGVAGNNDQKIAANIRGEEDRVDLNDEGRKGVDNKFNNLCNKDDNYDDANLVVGEGVAENIDQEIAANIKKKHCRL